MVLNVLPVFGGTRFYMGFRCRACCSSLPGLRFYFTRKGGESPVVKCRFPGGKPKRFRENIQIHGVWVVQNVQKFPREEGCRWGAVRFAARMADIDDSDTRCGKKPGSRGGTAAEWKTPPAAPKRGGDVNGREPGGFCAFPAARVREAFGRAASPGYEKNTAAALSYKICRFCVSVSALQSATHAIRSAYR